MTPSILPSYVNLLLVICMIISGQAFRSNWKYKGQSWVLKSWVYGLISVCSLLSLLLLP